MIAINPIKDITIDTRQPWLYLYRFTDLHQIVSFSLDTTATNLNGYIELHIRTFKNNVYTGELTGSYDRLYRLNDDNVYAYEIRNESNLTYELWARFVSRNIYIADINLTITNIETIESNPVSEDEMISILRLDSNWNFDGAGSTNTPYLKSLKGGENAIGSCEFGYYTPNDEHTRLWLALTGGIATNQTLKLIQFVSETDAVLASYNVSQLLGNPIVNDGNTPYRYYLPLHSSKERFKVRLTDNDNGGAWAWFAVYPEMCLLSV